MCRPPAESPSKVAGTLPQSLGEWEIIFAGRLSRSGGTARPLDYRNFAGFFGGGVFDYALATKTMTRRGTWLLACGPWLAAGWLAGCTVVADLGRFEPAASGGGGGTPDAGAAGSDAGAADAGPMRAEFGCANPQTLCVRLQKWPHKRQLTVVDLVTDDDNNLRTRAMLEPFGIDSDSTDIVLPLAIPVSEVPKEGADHPLHLEIWADQSDDGEYTPDVDHDWERDVPADGIFVFVHDTVFKDLLPRPRGIGADFHMKFHKMEGHAGRMFEIMVIEQDSGRTVGFARVQEIPPDGEFEVFIPDIIDPGSVAYRLEFFADADADTDRTYSGIEGGDHPWVKVVESNDEGIETEFTHGTEFTELDYQFDFDE